MVQFMNGLGSHSTGERINLGDLSPGKQQAPQKWDVSFVLLRMFLLNLCKIQVKHAAMNKRLSKGYGHGGNHIGTT